MFKIDTKNRKLFKIERYSKLKKGQSIENIDKNGHNW